MLYLSADLAHASAVLRAGLDDLGDRDPDLAALLYAQKVLEHIGGVYPAEAADIMKTRLRELAARGTPASRCAQLALAFLLAFRGESPHEVAWLVECGWDDGRFLAKETSESEPAILANRALVYIDELNRAQERSA